jgi:hypothetical protein
VSAPRLGLVALLVALAGCTQQSSSSITIELEEVNDSGISGKVELTPEGERRTRITVVELEGGEITGVRIMGEQCKPDGMDDKYPIKPPSGVVGVEFELVRRWDDSGPLGASFMSRGRYVACGDR